MGSARLAFADGLFLGRMDELLIQSAIAESVRGRVLSVSLLWVRKT